MVKVNGYSLSNPKRLPNNIDNDYLDKLYQAMVKNNLEIDDVYQVMDNKNKNGRYITFSEYTPEINSDGTRFIYTYFGYFPNK